MCLREQSAKEKTNETFMGGGASLLKRYAPAAGELCRAVILEDVCLNAKGYEALQKQLNEQTKQVQNG